MTYDDKYNAMPLRGKISVNAWARENNECQFGETSRRYKRKLHRHYDPYKGWWLEGLHVGWSYKRPFISKGHKRKTWKDYR